ncbi:MAG: hypothetical protein ABJB21_00515 [bacterium]
MKKNFRYIVLLTLMIFAVFGTPVSTSSSGSPVQQGIDPSCTSQCVFLLMDCAANGGKNNYHACYSVYKHCMAQCGKHD